MGCKHVVVHLARRCCMVYLARLYPPLGMFLATEREHCTGYATWLTQQPRLRRMSLCRALITERHTRALSIHDSLVDLRELCYSRA